MAICSHIQAQQAFSFENIGTSEGLSQGMVYSIIQDRDGFIWIGTKEGLNRYDGYNFKAFTNDPYNVHSLSGNGVLALSEDSKGRLWICTENAGINVFDKTSGLFHRLLPDSSQCEAEALNRIIYPVVELPDGRYLAGTSPGNIYIFTLLEGFLKDNKKVTVQSVKAPATGGLQGFASNNKGQVYLRYLDSSLYVFRPETLDFLQISDAAMVGGFANNDGSMWLSGTPALLKDNLVYPVFVQRPGYSQWNISIAPYGNNKLWLGGWSGLACYDISQWQPGKPIDLFKSKLFEKEEATSRNILLDKSGNLWQGRRGLGLSKLVLASLRFKHIAKGISVRTILPFGGDSMILGTWQSNQYRNISDKIIPQPLFSRKFNNEWNSSYVVTKKGNVWVHPLNEDFVYYIKKETGAMASYPLPVALLSAEDNQPAMEDHDGFTWFTGIAGNMVRINKDGKAIHFRLKDASGRSLNSSSVTTALYQDNNAVYWVGTTIGFAKVDFNGNPDSNPTITWFQNDLSDRNSINYNHVSCFLDDPTDKNLLWIGTKGGGLNRLDKSTGYFYHLTTKEGLPNDVVYGLLPDTLGNIWGSTNKGLFCIMANKKNNPGWEIRTFSKADGLQDDEFNTGAYTVLPDGELAFGGVNGVSIFKPAEVLNAGFQPRVFITNILVGNKPVLPNDGSGILDETIEYTRTIHLNHLQDVLTLEFSSLDFTAPAKNKYRYQLEGVDKDWVESGNRRSATYLHLPAGKFVFKVQGSNSQGEWSSHIAQLEVIVMPPWWRTWWAYLIYTLLIAVSIRVYFRFYVNRAKLEAQLNYEKLEARRIKELDTVKTQLYTNITHEFRTPLTVIIGMAQQVIANPKTHLQSGMEMIVRNGKNLLNLVNEMLDLSKLETGKMHLNLAKGDLINFLRYIVESFHSLAESQHKQLHLLAELDELQVLYDAEKVRQILSNLLSNALKFTPEKGNIYVTVNTQQELADGPTCKLVLKVKDTGIGIPEEQIEHIFDRFYQLDNSHSRKTEGTGIGLALTKELVKLMQGEITVKSPPTGSSRGTEFTVILPFEKTNLQDEPTHTVVTSSQQSLVSNAVSTHRNRAEIEQPDNSEPKQRPLILLVEDNADVVAYTASCLPDYRLAVGKDGAEGFEIATELIPDLIITDVMMPFVDGFELTRKLRRHELTSHIPIIMLTAKADLESKIEGIQHGADVYLEKPFNREELLVRIQKLLELRQQLQEHYIKNAGLYINNQVDVNNIGIKADSREKNAEDAFVKKVREVVEAHVADASFSIDQLCKLVFMSHSQLHRKLDALTGYTPNKFIRIIRLNKARELLINNDESIASIALDCGYNDAGYFSRVFKQEFGITPQEWRGSL